MSDSLRDVLLTDAELDQIALREMESHEDFVLAGLASLALAVDETPLPAVEPIALATPMSGARKGGFALAATVALVLSSSGVAAAVTDDPMAPLHFVARHVWSIAPHGRGQLPGWDSDGSEPISVVPRVDSRPGDGRAAGAASPDAQPTVGLRLQASNRPQGRLDVLVSSGNGSHASGDPARSGHGDQGLTSPPRPPRRLPGQSGHPKFSGSGSSGSGSSGSGSSPELPGQPNSPGDVNHSTGGQGSTSGGSTSGGAHVDRAPSIASACHRASQATMAMTCVRPTPPVARPTATRPPATRPPATRPPATAEPAAGQAAPSLSNGNSAAAADATLLNGRFDRPHHHHSSHPPAAGD